MTGDEAKKALLDGSPVVWDDPAVGRIIYTRINAIRYTRKEGKIAVYLELFDRSGHSIITVPMKEVELYQE